VKDLTYTKLQNFVEFCIRNRVAVAGVYLLLTLVLTLFAARVHFKTVFEDLLPRSHPYVQVHERFQEHFGGSNVISIMLEVKQGDIFNQQVLEKVRKITNELPLVDGVNSTQIVSLASNKLREIRASTDAIEARPVMWPDIPKTPQEMQALKSSVLNSPLIYGPYVSRDLKSTLITVDFYESLVDYNKIFPQITKLAEAAQGDDDCSDDGRKGDYSKHAGKDDYSKDGKGDYSKHDGGWKDAKNDDCQPHKDYCQPQKDYCDPKPSDDRGKGDTYRNPGEALAKFDFSHGDFG